MALIADLGTVEHLFAKGFMIAIPPLIHCNFTCRSDPLPSALPKQSRQVADCHSYYILFSPNPCIAFSYIEYQNRCMRTREENENPETVQFRGLFGDPAENRTRVTAVKGRCLDRLTTGP